MLCALQFTFKTNVCCNTRNRWDLKLQHRNLFCCGRELGLDSLMCSVAFQRSCLCRDLDQRSCWYLYQPAPPIFPDLSSPPHGCFLRPSYISWDPLKDELGSSPLEKKGPFPPRLVLSVQGGCVYAEVYAYTEQTHMQLEMGMAQPKRPCMKQLNGCFSLGMLPTGTEAILLLNFSCLWMHSGIFLEKK